MNPVIELSRGLAAFMVLTCHYYPLFIDAERSFFNFLWTGVDLFFLMSGFVFGYHVYNRKFDIPSFYIRRFFRIYPLYILSLILYFFYTQDHPEKVVYFVKHLFFLNTTSSMTEAFFFNPAYWSLPVEIEFYLFLPLLGLMAAKPLRFRVFIGFAILLKLLISIPAPHTSISPGIWSLLNVHLPGILPEFIIGILLYRFYESRKNPVFDMKAFLLGITILILSATAFVRLGDQGIQGHFLLRFAFQIFYTFGYAMVLSPFLHLKPGRNFLKICLFMGSISYGVYLFHNLIPKIFLYYHIQLEGIEGFLISLFSTIFLSFLTYHIWENPWRNYGRKLTENGNLRYFRGVDASPAKTA